MSVQVMARIATDDDGLPQACTHEQLESRIRTLSNGTEAVWWQCLTCGHGVRPVRKDEHQARHDARHRNRPFDQGLKDEWDSSASRAWSSWRERRTQDAGQRNAAWWAEYNAYLSGETWRRKRRMRLELDRYECQARLSSCEGRASQVHHLSYRHVGNEPLFELVSVCVACHDALTSMDRGQYDVEASQEAWA